MPRADDVPFYNVDYSCQTPCTHNPLGVKGCGEAGAIGSPPAVVNAVIDALHRGGHTHVTAYRHARLAGAGMVGDQRLREGADMHNFDFVKPGSIADAVKALSSEGAQALVGGADPDADDEAASCSTDGSGQPDRHPGDAGRLHGRGWPVDRGSHDRMPLWRKRRQRITRRWPHLAAGIGDPAVRNRGTIGGSRRQQ